MARPNIESTTAPVQGSLESSVQTLAVLLLLGTIAAVTIYPGALIGAAIAAGWRWVNRPPAWLRISGAVGAALPTLALSSLLQSGWLWHDILAGTPLHIPAANPDLVWRSLPIEALLGPAILETFLFALLLARRSLGGQIRRDHRRELSQWRALSGRRGLPAMLPDPHIERDLAHPQGFIGLGTDGETGRPLDLQLPGELASHVFMPGASNTGKTTTLLRIADGAIANWYGVVIIDCKGGDLGDAATHLAQEYDLPLHIVDPDDPHTDGYDICAGDGAAVANKLIGAFSYGPEAEIYKNIAMEAIPLVVEGLIAAGEPVTLERLYDAFGPRGFAIIAQQLSDDDRLRKRLLNLAAGEDKVGTGGRAGLQHRIGALMEGKFGPLFRHDDMLDWNEVLAEPSVTYIALSTLASSEDVELMGRVIAQDLKQVCHRRIRALRERSNVVPFLAIFDEFAALREADQLVDLLLQARQALMPTVISTQYIPETTPLRKATLSAGLIIAHRVEGNDAEEIANQFGTHKSNQVTHQIDYETGYSEKGSSRRVDEYNVNPNILRTLQQGYAALKSTARGRHAIVHITRIDP